MAVFLSPVGGVAAQFFTNTGAVLTGGKLYSYLAGTTTPAATYTSAAGATFNPNPIILDAAGRVPNSGEIWLTDSTQYKFVLKDSNDVLIATWDNITGINSNFLNFNALEEVQTATAGQTVFTLTNPYTPGTNTLQVFVDGVNQYDGSSYSYVETNSTRVTFTQGLHVGALVKFTTAVTLSAGVTSSNLVTYNEGGSGAINTTVQAKLRQYVSVKDFGATGDGTTNDTAAIQSALDSTANGGAVYIPTGTYSLNSTLSFASKKLTIYGDGAGSILLGDNTVLDANLATGSVFRDFQIKHKSNVWTFDLMDSSGAFLSAAAAAATATFGSADNKFTYSVNMQGQIAGLNAALTAVNSAIVSTEYITRLQISNSDYVLVDNVTGYFGQIHLYRCNYSTVQNCNIYGGNNWGTIYFENGGTVGVGANADWGLSNQVLNNNIRYGGYNGIILMRQKYTLVQGNTVYRCGESGVKTYQGNSAGLSGTGVNSRRCYNVKVVQNSFIETVYDGVDATADITGGPERVDDYLLSQYANHLLPLDHIVEANYVRLGDIFFDGVAVRVTKNTIENSRTSGIQSIGGGKNLVEGNTIRVYNTTLPSTGQHGISCDGSVVLGNEVIAGNPTSGYPIFNPNGITVNNIVYGTGTYIYGANGGLNWQDYGGTMTPTFKVATNKFTADFDTLGPSPSNNFLVNTANKNSGNGMGWSGSDNYAFISKDSVSTAQTMLTFWNSIGLVGSITTTGSATAYVTSSDYRLKNSIAPMTGALNKVAQLKPVTYKWNADGSVGEGFIAHELAEVCPHAVFGEKDCVDENDNPVYQGIDTSFLIATLTSAIQELKAEFDAYKASHS